MFELLILSVIMVIGSFLLINIADFYNSEFSVMMRQVFTDEFVALLEETADSENALDNLSDTIASYIGPLGINTYRFYCILDAHTGEVLVSSDSGSSENLEKTDNIITAMTGRCGNIVNAEKNYMDYAVALNVNSEPKYIVYVKDSKNEMQSTMQSMFIIMLQSLFFAAIIAIVVGYLLSRTITEPIIRLTKSAEKLAEGKFEKTRLSSSNDEIGRLSNTFYFMSSTLQDTINELKSEKTKVEVILQNMTDGVLAFNIEGGLIHINPTALNLLQSENISVSDSTNFDELFHLLGANITIDDLLYVKKSGIIERELALEDEQFLRLNFATFTLNNKIGGIVVVMHDATREQKLELSRREFVANVSHELRTPLTTIKSYAETLSESPIDDPETGKRFLDVISSEADRMTRIVKDLLTLSHLDHNHAEDEKQCEEIQITPFVENIVNKMSINAKNKNQTMTFRAINKTPPFFGNVDRLEQVIVNIISNAVKYTPEGGKIDIFTGMVYNNIYIKVIDNGIGIPKESLSRVFERFYRVDKARSRGTGGTGLGLAIAKQIIESFNGNISITSEPDNGTEVIITLPVKSKYGK